MDRKSKKDVDVGRREMLSKSVLVAAGALAATVGSGIMPTAARAGTDGDVVLGGDNIEGGTPTYVRRGDGSVMVTLDYYGTAVIGYTDLAGATGLLGNASASSGTGTGVAGTSTSGTGVRASSANGTALDVSGKAKFSRSGLATISRGKMSRTVTGLANIAADSMILATLQGTGGTGVVIRYATRVSSTSFKVVLNKAAANNVKFAWFIAN